MAKNKSDVFTIVPASDRAARIKTRHRNNSNEDLPNKAVSKQLQRNAAWDRAQEGDMESAQNVAFDCLFLNSERCQSEEVLLVIYSIQSVGLVFLCSLPLSFW